MRQNIQRRLPLFLLMCSPIKVSFYFKTILVNANYNKFASQITDANVWNSTFERLRQNVNKRIPKAKVLSLTYQQMIIILGTCWNNLANAPFSKYTVTLNSSVSFDLYRNLIWIKIRLELP